MALSADTQCGKFARRLDAYPGGNGMTTVAVAGGTGTVGRLVVEALRRHGAEPTVLSRSGGVDLVSGRGVVEALQGVDAVVDVSNVQTTATRKSVSFFQAVTRTLLTAEQVAGVQHHVALSIVGIDSLNSGYYAGKRAQERLLTESDMSWSILRSTQFHEFAAQLLSQATLGPIAVLPSLPTQPIAAREVAEALAGIAVGPAVGRHRDLAGPRREQLVDMARRYAAATGSRRLVVPVSVPGETWKAIRAGALLPGPGAEHGEQTFDEWLAAAPARQR
jgi:uncharacterized protein YbjT (DUF2867 family)